MSKTRNLKWWLTNLVKWNRSVEQPRKKEKVIKAFSESLSDVFRSDSETGRKKRTWHSYNIRKRSVTRHDTCRLKRALSEYVNYELKWGYFRENTKAKKTSTTEFGHTLKNLLWHKSKQRKTNNMYSHKELKYVCYTCQAWFAFESRLKSHSVIHKRIAIYPYIVKDCSQLFKRESDLTKHVKSHSQKVW